MGDFPVLQTPRLVLREFRQSDVPAVFDIFSRDEVTRYHNRETMDFLNQAEEMVFARVSLFEEGFGVRWGIVMKQEEDTVVGSCGFYHLNKANDSVEVGCDLHPAYWRQGIMTEALSAVIEYAFSERFFFWLNRIEALTYLEQEASIGLLKKLGFKEEGIRREYGHWKGDRHDLRSFALLRRDWEPALG